MPVTVHKGDLFAASIIPPVYAHGVNCNGKMGKGIAVEFKARFPEMYELYRTRCKEGLMIPGLAWLWNCDEFVPIYDQHGMLGEKPVKTFVYNLAIKSHWRLPATYNAVETSLVNMVNSMEEKGLASVSMPWVGCGLGGLDKKYVKKLMEKAVSNSFVNIDVYEI